MAENDLRLLDDAELYKLFQVSSKFHRDRPCIATQVFCNWQLGCLQGAPAKEKVEPFREATTKREESAFKLWAASKIWVINETGATLHVDVKIIPEAWLKNLEVGVGAAATAAGLKLRLEREMAASLPELSEEIGANNKTKNRFDLGKASSALVTATAAGRQLAVKLVRAKHSLTVTMPQE